MAILPSHYIQSGAYIQDFFPLYRPLAGDHGLVNVGMAMSIWELDSLDPKLDPYF